jgi:DNA-binding IclR family transcriptional regulator
LSTQIVYQSFVKETRFMNLPKSAAKRLPKVRQSRVDPLAVKSVEKAFLVLNAFGGANFSMSLTQLASAVRLDISAAQRFTHTLTKLGYLQKDPPTRRFGLGVKALDLGHHYLRANLLVERAMPYLLHLSKTTEETVNLTVRDDTEVVFIVRFMCRQLLNLNDTGVIVGARMPAYCTASGIAILSQLPPSEAGDILSRSELRAYTPHTTCRLKDLLKKLETSAARGYATAFEEFFLGDLAVAAPILTQNGPAGAINISVPRARFSREEAEEKFSSLVVAAAQSVSQKSNPRL